MKLNSEQKLPQPTLLWLAQQHPGTVATRYLVMQLWHFSLKDAGGP
jgi:hypothetical protein